MSHLDEPARCRRGEDGNKGRDDLKNCRVRIDEIDLRLLELLNQRTAIVEEIGRIKQELQLAIYEPKREEQVFSNVMHHNQGPLPHDAVQRIFERIIDEMRNVQKLKIQERTQT
ncbi:MAG TPA: chorismate mutase [Bryobacteraceae bacterium]|jgi:chorismate mutase-like protein|nr:chorismate mutase [Bryobacteraceae bacterium]